MKKNALSLIALAMVASSPLFATSDNIAGQKGSVKSQFGQMQDQTMDQTPDCSKLTPDEQSFANQLMDMNNKTMFCTQFTSRQRQQAMQMMGQQDVSGNMMTADQAVKQAMQNNGMAPDCTKLTSDEQSFANQVLDMNNRTMFCTQFTVSQRRQAMQMMGQQDTSGNMMTADQAVKQVMQNNGMTPMNQRGTSSSGGCPVK
jgi:hypothetical protein